MAIMEGTCFVGVQWESCLANHFTSNFDVLVFEHVDSFEDLLIQLRDFGCQGWLLTVRASRDCGFLYYQNSTICKHYPADVLWCEPVWLTKKALCRIVEWTGELRPNIPFSDELLAGSSEAYIARLLEERMKLEFTDQEGKQK